ncbi:hypothetical protein [Mesorhizobium dulcispinae]|uniref:hypothetical protein n=1 Tax=Mesorhizobium dulcispinae TaxID=3072316 RepID=UPI002A23D7E3|nr:hypothetical protein [Mesorhizobium sp. VK23D]MDX8521296.1 hypothetical protein [Mesorhizobium sp. VK23D]
MISELQVSVVSAGGAALVAEDHLDQVVVQAPLVRPEPLHQFRHVEDSLAPASETIDRQTRAAFKFAAERTF